MRYDRIFDRRERPGDRFPAGRRARGSAPPPIRERQPGAMRGQSPDGPFHLYDGGFRGRGPVGRYGDAPVPYGPDHEYDFHHGDRFGSGPDFWSAERRLRRRREEDRTTLRRQRP